MPRAFNENERTNIRHHLRESGRRLFATTGVVRTSLDQLTSAAGIAKGSFYKFYDSKELLFMELLEESQNRIRAPLLKGRASSRRMFEQLLRNLFDDFCADPLMMLMGREVEFQTVVRRLPPDYLPRHQKDDQDFLDALIERWNTIAVPPKRDVVAARITLLVMLGTQRDFMGARLLPHAVTAAITGLGDCFFKRA